MPRRTLTLVAALVPAALLATALVAPATAFTGGPDGAGYSYTDSTEPDGPAEGPFTSIAPADGGSGVDIGNHCADCKTVYSLPFPVSLYDLTTSTVVVGSSGYLEVPASPIAAEINAFRYPLRTKGGGNGVFAQTSGTPGSRTLVVEWRGVLEAERTVREQFQVVLYEDSEQIDLRYLDINPESPDGTPPGAASIYGGVGNRFLPYPDLLRDGLAVRFTRQVEGGPTRVALSAKPADAFYGQPLTLRAAVTAVGSSGARPSGSVTFYDKDEVLGSAPVGAGGVARLRLTSLTPDYYGEDFVARYDGDATHRVSYSATIHYEIQAARTTTTLAVPPDGTVRRGGPGLKATVALVKPSRGAVSGSVIWYVDDSYFTETPVVRGRATLPSSALPLGDHVVQASLNSELVYVESSDSEPVSLTVVE